MTRTTLSEEDIFQVARRIETVEARAAYLTQVCGDNAALREHVEALLRAYDESQSFLEVSPGAVISVNAANTPTIDKPVVQQVGVKIGPYKLLQQIGEGGMGAVYMAEQQEPVRRKVALKIIKPGMDTRQVIARFEAERQALSLMDHPNIARVLDAGTTDRGRPYFVMELVKGQPITQYCDEKRLTPRQRLELLLPVCQAIQHAHQKGIIHRDIKPSNVIVAEYDQKAVPKVIDFGVAKAISQPLTEKTMFTGYGQIVGTLEYMSPEQAKVNQLDIDTRSDIYSLGVLLYELLTGSTPFDKQRLRSAAWDEMLRVIREEEPPKPSTRLSDSKDSLPSISAQRQTEPAKLTRLFRGEIDWIVMKAIEKDRARRYQTANGLVDDIQHYLHNEPVMACPPSAAYRFRKFVARNRRTLTAVVVSGGVLLVALGVVAGVVGWAVRDRDARQAAVEREAATALQEAERLLEQAEYPSALSAAQKAATILAGGGGELKERVNEMRKDLEMAQRLDAIRLSRVEINTGTDSDPRTEATYAQVFRDYGIDIQDLPMQDAVAQIRARRIHKELVRGLDDWLLASSWEADQKRWRTLFTLAQVADPDPSRNRVRQTLDRQHRTAILNELASPNNLPSLAADNLWLLVHSPTIADAPRQVEAILRNAWRRTPNDFWINLGLAYSLYNMSPPQLEEATRFYTAALALRPDSTFVLNNLGITLAAQGKIDDAITCYRRVIELDSKLWRAHFNLGIALKAQGKLEDAVSSYRKGLELNPNSAAAHNALGTFLSEQGKPDEAVASFLTALELAPDLPTPGENLRKTLTSQGQLDQLNSLYAGLIPRTAIAQFQLGKRLQKMGLIEEAVKCHRRAIELDPTLPYVHFVLGNLLRERGQLAEASASFRKAIEIEPTKASSHFCLGCVLYDQGRPEDAEQCLRRAIELDATPAASHYVLGNVLLKLGRDDEAAESYVRAVDRDPTNAHAHAMLGDIRGKSGRWDEAIAAYRKAIDQDGKSAPTHLSLGLALKNQGNLGEAIVALRRAAGLFGTDSPQAERCSAAIRECEDPLALAARLPSIVNGNEQPRDVDERLAFAELAYHRKQYAGAVRLWSEALKSDLSLGHDRPSQHRYKAACAAVLAGCENGSDEPPPDELTRSKLRQHALDWLRAELTAWATLLESPGDIPRGNISKTLQHWQVDADLTGIRETTELAKLPGEEQSLFEQLWKDVASLRTRADSPAK